MVSIRINCPKRAPIFRGTMGPDGAEANPSKIPACATTTKITKSKVHGPAGFSNPKITAMAKAMGIRAPIRPNRMAKSGTVCASYRAMVVTPAM